MNAAILLVSSAWMAGQTPDVIIPVGHASSCGTPCSTRCSTSCSSSCCDSGPRLCDRIRGLFHRDNCRDTCAPARCQEVRCQEVRCREVRCQEVRCHDQCSQPRCHSFHWPQLNLGNHCRSSCNTCGHRQHVTSCDSCGRATSCDSCGHGCDLFARVRNAFHRDCGCNGGCTNGHGSDGTPSAEPIREQPKKMPSKGEPKKAQETRIITPPAQAPETQITPVIRPTLAPRIIENDTRNPF